MKWKVEYITPDSTNILVDDPSLRDGDKTPVAMGFPSPKLPESIVRLHNEVCDAHEKRLEEIKKVYLEDRGVVFENLPPNLVKIIVDQIDGKMDHMKKSMRYNWCEEGVLCGCMGCANKSGGLAEAGFTKAHWEDWVRRNPEDCGAVK